MRKEKSSQAKSDLFLTLLQLAMLACIGYIGAFSTITFFGRSINLLLILAYFFVFLYASIYLQTIIHEGGHLVMGLLTGYRFLSFRVGSFMWIKQNGKIRFGRFSMPGTGGQCLLTMPAPKDDGSYPYALYNWGGVLFNLISVVLSFIILIFFRFNPYVASFSVIMALVGIYLAILNGIPFPGAMIPNDAANVRLIGKSPSSYRSMRITNQTVQEIANGIGTADLPDEWFVRPSIEEMQNPITTTLAVMACDRLISKQDYTGAKDEIRDLLNAPIAVSPYHRNYLQAQLLLCLLLTEHTADEINALYTKPLKNFVQMMSTTILGLVCQYAVAVLWEKNPQNAILLRKRLDKLATHYPYPVEIKEAQELLKMIDQQADLKTAIPKVPPQGEDL